MKNKETLEEAARKYGMADYGSIEFKDYSPEMKLNYARVAAAFISGAKWQQERSYNEEELRNKLLDINLVNPSHLQMTSNGHGEFPDSYKLTQKGIDYIIEQFKKK